MLTPLKAIREKCLECSAGSYKEVELCPIEDCALYMFRFGKNPNRKGKGWTEERKAQQREIFKKNVLKVN
jgi:hypothetical protein